MSDLFPTALITAVNGVLGVRNAEPMGISEEEAPPLHFKSANPCGAAMTAGADPIGLHARR